MADSGTEALLNWIMSAPGLSHIAELIFLQLDPKSVITCIDVCSIWKWYIIDNGILKKNILNDKRCPLYDYSAPKHSHNRVLLKKLLGSKFEENEKLDPEEEFNAFREYVEQIDPQQIEKKLSFWPLPKVKVFVLRLLNTTTL